MTSGIGYLMKSLMNSLINSLTNKGNTHK